jgi:hypothetical protein
MAHIRDVRRWANLNYLHRNVSTTRQLLQILRLNLQPDIYTKLGQSRLNQPLRGFQSSQLLRIHSLSDLLHENWLSESVLDARLDLFAQELTFAEPGLIRFLPCYFYVELSNAYHQRQATDLVTRYRDELLVNPPAIIGFVMNKQGVHWAPVAVVPCLRLVLQGDSFNQPACDDLPDMVQWWLQDIVCQDGQWVEQDLPTPQQEAGSGSCGLAAVSALVKYAWNMHHTLTGQHNAGSPSPSTSWTHETSSVVRTEWIASMVCHHVKTLDQQPVRSMIKQCTPSNSNHRPFLLNTEMATTTTTTTS